MGVILSEPYCGLTIKMKQNKLKLIGNQNQTMESKYWSKLLPPSATKLDPT